MRLSVSFSLFSRKPNTPSFFSTPNKSLMTTPTLTSTPTTHSTTPIEEGEELDERLCADFNQCSLTEPEQPYSPNPSNWPSHLLGSSPHGLGEDLRIERAWAYWRKLGEPKLIVAPMVDNSELPFRMLCRKYGAQAAYTPMLHSRIFTETPKYRASEFTTCKEDRPLFAQFCANDPDTLLEAAQLVAPHCDYVDINLGCPQRIARRGNYGAFLMDNLPLIKALVEKLAMNLSIPVSCKIRIFPKLEDTLAYAKMLENAGCSLLAVHGRTRDEKDGKKIRADWDAIKAVKNALRIPVLANGNIRHMDDVSICLKETGVDGLMSAETLLENPALFAGYRTAEWLEGDENCYEDGRLDQADLLVEYLKLCEKYPVPWRMIRAHVHRLLGEWFRIHPHIREDLNKQSKLTFEFLYGMVNRLKGLGGSTPLYVKGRSQAGVSVNGVANLVMHESLMCSYMG